MIVPFFFTARYTSRENSGNLTWQKVSTIRDVAELANVSKATVSRYLNGTLTLPAETRKRVELDAVVA